MKKYTYYFWIFGKEQSFKAESMQKAVDDVMWRHFCGSSKGKVLFESSNDPCAPDQGELKHVGSFINGHIELSLNA